MIRPFLTLVLVLTAGIAVAGAHYMYSPKNDMVSDIAIATGMVSPVLSVAYYEPRILLIEHASNPAYPLLPPIDRLDFIYEK